MSRASLDKGKRGERDVIHIIDQHLGVKCRRHQAGHVDDIGDIFGVPFTTIQVADWSDALRAVREKPVDAELQRRVSGDTFAATFVKLRGGAWRVVMLPEHWATYVRESIGNSL